MYSYHLFFQTRIHKLHQVLQQNLRSRTIEICLLFVYTQRAEQVTLFCRQQVEYSDDDEPKPSVHLSQAQKLRKVIIELVDTERSYVKVNKTDVAALSLRWAFCVGHPRWVRVLSFINKKKPDVPYKTVKIFADLSVKQTIDHEDSKRVERASNSVFPPKRAAN